MPLQKAIFIRQVRRHVTPPLSQNFSRGHVGTLPESMHAKFKVRIFSDFGAISI